MKNVGVNLIIYIFAQNKGKFAIFCFKIVCVGNKNKNPNDNFIFLEELKPSGRLSRKPTNKKNSGLTN